MKLTLPNFGQNIIEILKKHPFVLLSSIVFCSTVLYLVDVDNESTIELLTKIAITSALGISLFFSLEMIAQRKGKQLLLNGIGVLILLCFYFYIPFDTKYELKLGVTIGISFLITHLLVAFTPFIKNKDEMQFWNYNKNLFIHFIVTGIFSSVLSGGLTLALFGIRELLNIPISELSILRIHLFCQIIGSTFIFLLFCRKGISDLEAESPYPIVLKFFVQYILIPLLLIYLVILYLYIGRIIINKSWPNGWVSYMLQIFSIVGILALLLIHPLKNSSEHKWVVFYGKAFFYSLTPLLVIQYIALFKRVNQYGFTDVRFLLLLLSIWLTFITIYFILKPKGNIRIIPISLALFAFTAVYLPYFNAFSVGIRSQKKELMKILTNENLLKNNGEIDFSKPIKYELAENISDKLAYLYKLDQKAFVRNYLSDSLTKSNYYYKYDFIALFTNATQDTEDTYDQYTNYTYIYFPINSLNIKGFSSLITFETNGYDFEDDLIIDTSTSVKWSIKAPENSSELFLINEQGEEKYDLMKELIPIYQKYKTTEYSDIKEPFFIEGTINGSSFKIYFEKINFKDQNTVTSLKGTFLSK